MGRRAIVSLLICAQCGVALAAPLSGSRSWTLKEALVEAKSNSAKIREAQEKLEQFRAQRRQAWSTLFPKIDLTATQGTQKDSVASGSAKFNGETYNTYKLGLSAEQPLFTYGIFSGIGSASDAEELAKLDVEIVERNEARQLISVFYRTVMNENLISLLAEQEETVKEILGTAQKRMAVGGRKIDVLQVKTRLALLKPKIESAKNDLAASVAELAKIMGRSTQGELRLQGRLPELSVQQMQANLNLKEYTLPELKKLKVNREKLESEKDVALGKNLPNLKLKGDYGYANLTKSELLEPESKAWSAQLVLTIPLFSGFSTFHERRSFQSQIAQVELQQRDLADELSVKQIKSRKTLESAETSLASAEEAAKLARESLQEARREYRYGQIDFLQFMQVQSADYEAATSLLSLRYDAINAYADYFVSSGQNLDTLVDVLSQGEKK